MYGELDFCFIFSTLASLKDLDVMPLGQSFYEVVKITLNLTAELVQDRSLEGKEFALDYYYIYIFFYIPCKHVANT